MTRVARDDGVSNEQARCDDVHRHVGGSVPLRQLDADVEEHVAGDGDADVHQAAEVEVEVLVGVEPHGYETGHDDMTPEVELIGPIREVLGPEGAEQQKHRPARDGEAVVHGLHAERHRDRFVRGPQTDDDQDDPHGAYQGDRQIRHTLALHLALPEVAHGDQAAEQVGGGEGQ